MLISKAVENIGEGVMSVLAKLLWLEAIKSQDADGVDELVMSRGDGVQFWPTSGTIQVNEGAVEDLAIFLPIFDGDVEVRLHEIDRNTGNRDFLGSVFVRADEAGRGEQKQQFRGAGAKYELTYIVN